MADFKTAITKVRKSEGIYSNDPDDPGAETYCGVSRRFWPSWIGWQIIDQLKKRTGFPGLLKQPDELEIKAQLDYEVDMFYFNSFWIPIGGPKISNQEIANLLIDSAVNEGISPAIKRAEAIVGLSETGKISSELIIKLNLL